LFGESISVPDEQLRRKLESQSQLAVDQSPTKEHPNESWQWLDVATKFTDFGIFGNKSRLSLDLLAGGCSGIIVNGHQAKMYLDAN